MHAIHARATARFGPVYLGSGVCVQNINWTRDRRRVKVMADNEMPLDKCAAYKLRWGGKVVMMAAQVLGERGSLQSCVCAR